MIDELDRCRPTYAIELLETAKHIFGVDHVVFVLAVNRSELAHSVKALYGSEFGAEGYLRRFFDIDFMLPLPDREAFIKSLLVSIQIEQFFQDTHDPVAKRQYNLVTETLTSFLGRSDLSLRDVGQAIHRFGVVLSSLGNSEPVYARTLSVLTVLRAVDLSLYSRYIGGDDAIEHTIGSLFGRANFSDLRRSRIGANLEAVIIAAKTDRSAFNQTSENLGEENPLLGRYARILEGQELSPPVDSQERDCARIIYELGLRFHNLDVRGNESLGLEESAKRLEFL